jgi:arsenate reductase (glutaredoxin)
VSARPRHPVVVYGIPSCDTVKRARAWLDEHGVAHIFVDFRAQPPPREQVAAWLRAFGAGPMRNTSGASYRALPAAKAAFTDDEWLARFAADPMLIKRPVIERDGAPFMVGWRSDRW